MHECPNCGQACDCDGDDVWRDPPADCQCGCDEDDPCQTCPYVGACDNTGQCVMDEED